MRLQWATICRYGENTVSGLTVLGAGQSLVLASAFPGEIGLFVAGMITEFATLPASTNLQIAVLKSDETLVSVASWKVEFDLAENVKHVPAIEPSVGFAVPLHFEADEAGTYSVGIGLDDVVSGVLPLAILLDQPMEDELQGLL